MANSAKFVPAREKIKHISDALKKTQRRLQTVTRSMRKISSSKTMNPKLKQLRMKKAQALQKYLVASIMLDQARQKELKSPT